MRVFPETKCRTTGSFPSGDVQVMALFDPAKSTFAPLASATVIALLEPTISSHLQPPVKVSVLLLPKMWAPPPAQSKVVVWPEPANSAPAPSDDRPSHCCNHVIHRMDRTGVYAT